MEEDPIFCSKDSFSRGFLFGLIVAALTYNVFMFIIHAVNNGTILVGSAVKSIYESAGVFTGYSDENRIVVSVLLFSIGIIVGISGRSLLKSIAAGIVFFIVELVIFFSIGLLYLGEHYDYGGQLFSDYTACIVIPFIFLCFGIAVGYSALKRPKKSKILRIVTI